MSLDVGQPRRATTGILLAIALLLLANGCERAPRADIVLVTVDTLRWDRVGLHGSAEGATPAIDAFFADGTVFRNASSTAPCTLPAVPQMLTGRLGVRDSGPTLASRLRDAGYATVAVVSQHQFEGDHPSVLAVRRGFERFDMQAPEEKDDHGNSTRTADQVTARAIERLRALVDEEGPYFLWLHYFDPHDPYRAPGARPGDPAASGDPGDVRRRLEAGRRTPDEAWQRAGYVFSPSEVEDLRARYDDEVRFVDREIGRFLEEVQRRDRGGTLVAFSADHGERLGEENRWGHCQTLHEIEIRVPLMVRRGRGPLVAGLSHSDGAVSTLDLVPTLLAEAGIEAKDLGLEGEALGATRERPVPSLWVHQVGMKSGPWKTLLPTGDRPALYRLSPGDLEERSFDPARQPLVARRLLGEARRLRQEQPWVEVQNEEILDRLRTIGYVD